MNFLGGMTVLAMAAFIFVQQGFVGAWANKDESQVINVLLIGVVGIAVVYGYYLRKLRIRLLTILEFEKKMAFHRKYFLIKMWWNLLSGIVSCSLYLLTARKFFFWFVLFDLFTLLLSSPRAAFFKRELNDDEIVFL